MTEIYIDRNFGHGFKLEHVLDADPQLSYNPLAKRKGFGQTSLGDGTIWFVKHSTEGEDESGQGHTAFIEGSIINGAYGRAELREGEETTLRLESREYRVVHRPSAIPSC